MKEQLVKQEEFSSSFDMQLAPLGFSNHEFVDKIKVKIEELKVGEHLVELFFQDLLEAIEETI